MAHDDPAADEERGSWHLRSAGSWTFALLLWLAGLGGAVLFSQDGAEVAWARLNGVPGTVKIEKCAHSSSYALCYGPFDAADGSVRGRRLELRTLHHDRPGTTARTWLPSRTATHAWASDVNPLRQFLPAAPLALLALIQTVWITLSWRAWRQRRRRRIEAARPRPIGVAKVAPGPVTTQLAPPLITSGHRGLPQSGTGGEDRRPERWQDLRGTAASSGPSVPQQRARRQPWETPGHG
ncbi:hypothetical protein HC028_20440 [Planosporangium flavigriseum]|uniref:Uncharacterized protein n=1 Tax=Planosporangium flavigriseum TaxID=373681 RepID=A0A8J3M0D0_9ACTN|nr:hypothetical protein [Planosporangium flavigriseum]NJC66856.1 hypothetical protein [Planosporangium flavigriseum]GIG74400.1 hypothetical protein Pfl04_28040 [Planosporangium flavigriseum]